MKKYIHVLLYSIACLLLGFVFYIYQESACIILFPHNTNFNSKNNTKNILHKEVTLYYHYLDKTYTETTSILLSDNISQNIKQLLNAWLIFIDDEHITNQETQIISVSLCNSEQEALINLNQYPFDKSWSIYQKWMWVESFLKTLRQNAIPLTSIRLLVQHQPITDDHLNFDIALPITSLNAL